MSTTTISELPVVQAKTRRWDLTPAERARLVTWASLLLGAAGPFVVAAAMVPVRDRIDSANAALVLVVVVIAVAATARRLSAGVAAVSAALAFDLFFTRPFNSLSIRSSDDVETMVLLLVLALAVGQVAVVGRRYAAAAARRAGDVARLRRVGRLLAQRASVFEVVGAAQAELVPLLKLRSCRVESGAAEHPRPAITPEGKVVHGRVYWGTATMGLPGPEVELVGGGVRFVLEPTPGELVPADRLEVAAALAELAGAAVAGSR